MVYQFESLRVWQAALAYDDLACALARSLPPNERFGLSDQLRRASSSIGLNIAEGTTSQSDPEKRRFLTYAIRSLLETVAAQHLARRRGYVVTARQKQVAADMYDAGEELVRQLQAFKSAIEKRIHQTRPPDRRR